MLDGQHRKQDRAGYASDRNHIDHIVGCHRKHGGRRRWLRSRLCGRALWLRWHSLRSHGIPGNEEGLGGVLWLPDPDAFPVEVCPRSRTHYDMPKAANA